MGVNLWGESPLYVNPASVFDTFAQVLAEGKGGTARDRPKEAGAQSDEPTNRNSIQGRVPGKLARHNEALDSGDTVNAAVVSRKFTFLSGEICSTGIQFVPLQFGSLTEARVERPGYATGPYRMS